MSHIGFNNLHIKFSLKNKNLLTKWINEVITHFKFSVEYIEFIFCDDKYLAALNKRYLRKEEFTDVITFTYSNGSISGDIFISIERVDENAANFHIDFDSELRRVMIHGVLHLMGKRDKTLFQKQRMRKYEDFCLKSYEQCFT